MKPAVRSVPLAALALLLATLVTHAEILIGAAGPMSGRFAIFGEQIAVGARQAIADINANGGLLGQNLVLEIADDKCDRKQAEKVANSMADRQIAFMVGHLCSSASHAASAIYNESGIIQISPGAQAADYTDDRPGPGTLRIAPREDRQGEVAGKFLATSFARNRIAIIHDESSYGIELAEATRTAMNNAGKFEEIFDVYPADESDFRPLLTQLAAEEIDVLFFGGHHTGAALMLRRLDSEGIDVRLVAGDALLTEAFMEIAGKVGQGSLMTYPPDPASNAAAARIVEKLGAKDILAEGYILHTYAAVEAWAAAVEAAGTFEFDPVTKALTDGDFETVLGALAFDDRGDSSQPAYIVYEWRGTDGDYEYVPM
jgi:branched-chain amino acid transport system substrate-binding protein